MDTRQFDLSDILSVTTGRLLSERSMEGVNDILSFITQADVYTHQIPKAMDLCRPFLLAQYPQFSEDALTNDLARLDIMLKGVDTVGAGLALRAWIATLKMHYEATLPVESHPELGERLATPLADMLEMMRPDQELIIVDLATEGGA